MTAERKSARASPFRSPRTSSSGRPRRSVAWARALQRPARPAPRGAAAPRTRASWPTPRPATASRRRHRGADAPLRPREQRQDRQPDEEPIRRRSCAQAERDLERVAVAEGVAPRLEHRRAQLVQDAKASSISDSTPAARRTRMSAADSAAGSSGALSCRSRPRLSSSVRLSPARIAAIASSSSAHSASRNPARPMAATRPRHFKD